MRSLQIKTKRTYALGIYTVLVVKLEVFNNNFDFILKIFFFILMKVVII